MMFDAGHRCLMDPGRFETNVGLQSQVATRSPSSWLVDTALAVICIVATLSCTCVMIVA